MRKYKSTLILFCVALGVVVWFARAMLREQLTYQWIEEQSENLVAIQFELCDPGLINRRNYTISDVESVHYFQNMLWSKNEGVHNIWSETTNTDRCLFENRKLNASCCTFREVDILSITWYFGSGKQLVTEVPRPSLDWYADQSGVIHNIAFNVYWPHRTPIEPGFPTDFYLSTDPIPTELQQSLRAMKGRSNKYTLSPWNIVDCRGVE